MVSCELAAAPFPVKRARAFDLNAAVVLVTRECGMGKLIPHSAFALPHLKLRRRLRAAAHDGAEDVDQHFRAGGVDAFRTAADRRGMSRHAFDFVGHQRRAAGVFRAPISLPTSNVALAQSNSNTPVVATRSGVVSPAADACIATPRKLS